MGFLDIPLHITLYVAEVLLGVTFSARLCTLGPQLPHFRAFGMVGRCLKGGMTCAQLRLGVGQPWNLFSNLLLVHGGPHGHENAGNTLHGGRPAPRLGPAAVAPRYSSARLRTLGPQLP